MCSNVSVSAQVTVRVGTVTGREQIKRTQITVRIGIVTGKE